VQAYTTANRISGYSYDTAGNLLADGLGNTFTWDANEMISSSNGTSYYYDAEGDRMGKSGSAPKDTIYFGGRPVARLTGGAWTDLIYGAGSLLAEVPGTQTGAPVYRMTDPLGSSVGTLSSTGALTGGIQDYAPFGELFNGSSTTDPYKFTGKERDAESGNDYFGARYYASTAGRWLSPDWSANEEPVPYAKLDNPQSLNLYAYVGNNPLTSADLDGHEPGISHLFDFMNCLDPEACPATKDPVQQMLNRYKAQHQGAEALSGAIIGVSAQQQIPTPAQILQALHNRPPADYIDLRGTAESILGHFGIHLTYASTGDMAIDSSTIPIPVPDNLSWILAIANGHGWTDHGQNEFKSQADYQNMVLQTVQNAKGGDIVRNPDGRKGVTGFWNDSEGFVVWRDKYHPDQGTAFRPEQPDVYKKRWGFE
jgi:RHS repeat-associated protein